MGESRRRSWIFLVVLVLLAAWLASCGSDDGTGEDQFVGPLPVGADDPQAYTEAFLTDNPRAEAQLEHLLIVHLEPTANDVDDTCAERDGVDCIPYVVDEPTQIELSIAPEVEEVEEVALVDEAGAVLLRHSQGLEVGSVVVEPGVYRLELHHAFAGEAAAPEETIFVLPEMTGGGAADGAALASAVLTVRNDCPRCNFSGALLRDESFDGLDLSGAIFNRARMDHTTFRGAKIADGQFIDTASVYGGGAIRGTAWDKSPVDADFTGATLSRAKFALRGQKAFRFHFSAVFRGAKLDGSVWNGRPSHEFNNLFNGDFSNADLTDSRWEEANTIYRRETRPQTPQCTFQGADLTRARFTGDIKAVLSECRFDKDPQSGRATTLKDATLGGAELSRAAMSDADLTGATLEGAMMEGTILSRAKLAGAKVAKLKLKGAVLTDATIGGIVPATLNGFDLTATDFTGVDFAGLDLSGANLSKSVLDAAPKFAGATLSDGRRGVDLEGKKFAARYAAFKGVDLSGANLNRADLYQANLEGTTLNGAQLIGATLSFANLHRAKLQGAMLGVEPGSSEIATSLIGALMTDIDLSDGDLRSADLTGAHIYGNTDVSKLLRVRLDSANMSRTICSGALFSGSFNNTVFNGAQLVNTVFNGASLTNTKFDDAYLEGADFSNASGVSGTSLINAAVAAESGVWKYTEQDGTPYTLEYGPTKLGGLATQGGVRCPNGQEGPCCADGDLKTCLAAKLKPQRNGPFPPIPPCVPARKFCFENCLDPPNFDHTPPCF